VADVETLTDEALGIVDAPRTLLKPWAGPGFACPHCGQLALHEATQARIDALTEALRAAAGPCHALRVAAETRALELTERIERARKILDEGRPVDSAEARLAGDLRRALG
jgi:hypothetical protein